MNTTKENAAIAVQEVSTSQGEIMEAQSGLQAEQVNEGATNLVAGECNINNLKGKTMDNTKIALLDGAEKEITILFPANHLMAQPKDKAGILPQMDKSKLLDVTFNFAKPECFMKEHEPLVDMEGNPVLSLDGLVNPLVACQTADTYWRFRIEERFENVRVHEFESVQAYFKAIGTTMVYSRGFNALEVAGVAAQASGNETYKAIYEFARKNDLTLNTASLYLGIKLGKEQTLQLSVGNDELSAPKLVRTEEEAQGIHDVVRDALGKGGAKNRYGAQVANYFIKQYGLEITVAAFKLVPASAIAIYKLMSCGDKVSCLTEILSTYVKMVAQEFSKQAA